jgi:chemotaxis protein methyltransferase CheR
MLVLTQSAFRELQALFLAASGIQLTESKRAMMEARLRSRVEALGLRDFDAYCAHIRASYNAEERQRAIDLLTTNETYFFREPVHFQVLAEVLAQLPKTQPVRVWSAACSSGEEAFSIGMTILDKAPWLNWEVRASDLSERMLECGRRGVFPLQRLEHMPPTYLKRFALRGTRENEGSFRVADDVRRRVRFIQHNLLEDVPTLGSFDVIFVRNVLIYFDNERKQKILKLILKRLRPAGVLFLGLAESLQGQDLPLVRISNSVYRKRE